MTLQPLPDDPSASEIESMLDLRSDEWWLSTAGDYQTAAVEAMKADGTDHQTLIALEWPARRNHGTDHKTIRLLIHPDDAAGLAQVLTHTARWLDARRRRSRKNR